MADGDSDMDGEVDTADITIGFQNFTGLALDGLTALLTNKAWGGASAASGDFDSRPIPRAYARQTRMFMRLPIRPNEGDLD